ncbi:hypothetical protein [Aneurinibacillus danicus]|uniref:Uncharacterized protein n=1 Tax=Aneurinibacillus danicus TaxID=267746 RepID=A0A511V396_9BACL|nr:hypothetical protein [Aneurinibacillus danicus]GEN33376.1 hypothetical protein ADA01nite_08360 [Aneurinibacillus danicus]
MMLTLTFILFFVYVVLRIWVFSKNKEWRDLIVFALISGLVVFFMLVPMLGWESGALLNYAYKFTRPIAQRFIPVIFGVEV